MGTVCYHPFHVDFDPHPLSKKSLQQQMSNDPPGCFQGLSNHSHSHETFTTFACLWKNVVLVTQSNQKWTKQIQIKVRADRAHAANTDTCWNSAAANGKWWSLTLLSQWCESGICRKMSIVALFAASLRHASRAFEETEEHAIDVSINGWIEVMAKCHFLTLWQATSCSRHMPVASNLPAHWRKSPRSRCQKKLCAFIWATAESFEHSKQCIAETNRCFKNLSTEWQFQGTRKGLWAAAMKAFFFSWELRVVPDPLKHLRMEQRRQNGCLFPWQKKFLQTEERDKLKCKVKRRLGVTAKKMQHSLLLQHVTAIWTTHKKLSASSTSWHLRNSHAAGKALFCPNWADNFRCDNIVSFSLLLCNQLLFTIDNWTCKKNHLKLSFVSPQSAAVHEFASDGENDIAVNLKMLAVKMINVTTSQHTEVQRVRKWSIWTCSVDLSPNPLQFGFIPKLKKNAIFNTLKRQALGAGSAV